MKVYRYMSKEELSKYLLGITIVGKRSFSHCNTTSEGICFLSEIVSFYSDSIEENVEWTPFKCFTFLEGVVNADSILVEFNTDADMKKSAGVYADPFTDDWESTISVNELCIPEYNRDTFDAVRYCFAGEDVWYSIH